MGARGRGGPGFHWFDGPAALAEIHRVLRPGGRLALVWNARDEADPWQAELTDILDQVRGDAPRHAGLRWREAFERTDGFTPLELRSFPSQHRTTPQGVLDRVASVSFVAALPADGRAALLNEVRALMGRDPRTRGLEEFVMAYRTDVFWCERA